MTPVRQPSAVSAGPGRIGKGVRSFVFCFLLLGLLVRGLIPVGYMAERDVRSGELIVAMCSGAGEMQTIHLAPGETPSKGKSARQHCPFASLTTPVLPQPSLIVDARLSPFQSKIAYAPREVAPVEAILSASAPPTGPPLSA